MEGWYERRLTSRLEVFRTSPGEFDDDLRRPCGPREFRRFLDTTLGSLSEMSYAIMVVRELGFVSEGEWKELNDLRAQAGRLTWGLYRLIRSKETTART